jgi:hypothetical protein
MPERESVRALLVNHLYEIAPEEVTPKTISMDLHLNHGTVKRALRRLLAERDSPIVSLHRGWYRHKMNIDVIARIDKAKRIELHGIKLEGVCLQDNTGYCLAGQAKHRYRKRGFYDELFEDRSVRVTVHEMGLVEVWLSTSNKPMSFHQFDRFLSWVKGLLGFVAPWSWQIKQIGLNVDCREMVLDGIRSIKLAYFRNAWFQAYQRGEDTVRFEVHMLPHMALDEALFVLRQLIETDIPSRDPPYQSSTLKDDPSVR